MTTPGADRSSAVETILSVSIDGSVLNATSVWISLWISYEKARPLSADSSPTCVASLRSPNARARRRGAGRLPAPPPRRKPFATASRSLGSGAAGVRACRLVALAVPDPGRAIGSRPLIGPRIRPEAAGGPPLQVPWTVHSPSSTLGGPIEIPIPTTNNTQGPRQVSPGSETRVKRQPRADLSRIRTVNHSSGDARFVSIFFKSDSCGLGVHA